MRVWVLFISGTQIKPFNIRYDVLYRTVDMHNVDQNVTKYRYITREVNYRTVPVFVMYSWQRVIKYYLNKQEV